MCNFEIFLVRSHRVEWDYTGRVGNIIQIFFATAWVSGRQVAPKF